MKILFFCCFFFHMFSQNIDCGYPLEPPRRGGSNEYPQSILGEKKETQVQIFKYCKFVCEQTDLVFCIW